MRAPAITHMTSPRRLFTRFVRRAVGLDQWIEMALVPPTGQINLTEARFLGELMLELDGPGPIIEIGTLFGWSTRVMTLFKDPARELITVDAYVWNPLGLPPDAHHHATAAVLADAVQEHRVRLVREDKDAFYARYAGASPALVFLDADHGFEATRADIAWARRAGAGMIALHDYADHSPDVVRAVDAAGGPTRVVGTIAVLR
jgi:predicted O-methyltransferase YrrM